MLLRELIIKLISCGASMDAEIAIVCEDGSIAETYDFEIEEIKESGIRKKFCEVKLRTIEGQTFRGCDL